MKKLFLLLLVSTVALALLTTNSSSAPTVLSTNAQKNEFWFELLRRSNVELLYYGKAGEKEKSTLVKQFNVKSGILGKKPTPLPQLLGRDYWLIKDKYPSTDNPETAPYFLELDVPVSEESPFGPEPYLECDGQCDWELPGYFGLHGINGDMEKMSPDNEGSSGCVRHSDEDITYLYNLLDPHIEPIRYYVLDR